VNAKPPSLNGDQFDKLFLLAQSQIGMITEIFVSLAASEFHYPHLEDLKSATIALSNAIDALALKSQQQSGHKEEKVHAVSGAVSELHKGFVGKNVLVAEDNPVNQIVIIGLLKRMGLKADTVDNGTQVLERLATTTYDLILMDCSMPDLDGYDTTKAIRSKKTSVGQVPIVALTASSEVSDYQRCINVGMNDYLMKPVNTELLEKVLAKWLAKK
jgi:CheY-like chemotaxis protein